MQWWVTRSVLVFCFVFVSFNVPARALAAAPSVSADAGVHFFANGLPLGFGFNVYPGLELPQGLVPELQLGLHTTRTTVATFENGRISSRLYLVPVYIGGRYKLAEWLGSDTFLPFVGLHVGLNIACITDAAAHTAANARFGFNVGAGVDVAITQHLGVGGALWYDIVHNPDNADFRWLTLGLNVHATFG